MLKKLLTLFLALILVISCFSIGALAAGETSSSPISITFGKTYSKTWDYNTDSSNRDIWCKVTLPKKGLLKVNADKIYDKSLEQKYVIFHLYDLTGTTEYWYESSYNHETASKFNFTIPLNAGTYLFNFEPSVYISDEAETITMNYSFGFTANNTYEAEPNSIATMATNLPFETKINGIIDKTDDFYKSLLKKTPRPEFILEILKISQM